jgi:succinate dehydrogenase/fumarate reductase flavoprotein subunit
MKLFRYNFLIGVMVGGLFGFFIPRYIATDQMTLGTAYPLATANRIAIDLRALVDIRSNHVDTAVYLLKSDLKDNMTSLVGIVPEKQLTQAQRADLNLARKFLLSGETSR